MEISILLSPWLERHWVSNIPQNKKIQGDNIYNNITKCEPQSYLPLIGVLGQELQYLLQPN